MFVIAGATGHVGSVVARELLRLQKPVTVLLRQEARAEEWRALGAHVSLGELENVAFVTEALRGATGFFALQPPNYTVPDFTAAQTALANGLGTAIEQSGVPHVVLLSSLGAHLQSGTGPIQGLYQFERAFSRTNTVLSTLRSSYFQENVMHAVGPARGAGVFISMAPGPDEQFARIAVSDVGRFAAAALVSPPPRSEIVNLLGPAYSNREIARHLGAALGVELKLLEVPREGWLPGMLKAGLPERAARLIAEMNDALAKGWLTTEAGRRHEATTRLEVTLTRLLQHAAEH